MLGQFHFFTAPTSCTGYADTMKYSARTKCASNAYTLKHAINMPNQPGVQQSSTGLALISQKPRKLIESPHGHAPAGQHCALPHHLNRQHTPPGAPWASDDIIIADGTVGIVSRLET